MNTSLLKHDNQDLIYKNDYLNSNNVDVLINPSFMPNIVQTLPLKQEHTSKINSMKHAV